MLNCPHMLNTCPLASLSHTPLSHSLFRERFTTVSDVYKKLGQFYYEQPNCTTDRIKTCIDKDYNLWIYIGEVKKGTDDTPHGIGIQVWCSGDIWEGYWEDGELHGRGRHIYGNEGYYIGEFKGGRYNGEGTLYYENRGIEYEGGWKDGKYYGQGTLYRYNCDKYTGIWDDEKGQGEVKYNNGTKFMGHWDWKDGGYKRHGQGTLYSADGQVLNQGKWYRGEYVGEE